MFRLSSTSNIIRLYNNSSSVFRSSISGLNIKNNYCTSGHHQHSEHCNHQDHQHEGNEMVRVRYAPSPTGMMHLGGLRTALFNYLFAKKNNGKFILRIEDTDQTRLVSGSAQNLDDCLAWAGIPYDEGPKRPESDTPSYVQSERLAIYRQHAQMLLDNGSAYHCFCTSDRLESLRLHTKNKGPLSLYDRACLKLTKDEVQRRLARGDSYTVRLKIPTHQLHTKFTDIVKGNVQFKNQQIDDQILMKSDGFPTYHLASVVDDHLMRISHVIRGEEWLNSTPKHIILYEAFNWKPPKFAHVPLLLNTDKSKLSKRQGDVSVDSYINKGYLPQALVNFVALLGWSPSESNKEVFTLDELIENFSLEGINKASSVVNLERLDWLNVNHIRLQLGNDDSYLILAKQIKEKLVATLNLDESKIDDQYLKRAVQCVKERIVKIDESHLLLAPFFVHPQLDSEQPLKMKEKVWSKSPTTSLEHSRLLLEELSQLPESQYQSETIYRTLQSVARKLYPDVHVEKELTAKTNQLMSILRFLITGSPMGGSLPLTIEILGKSLTIDRINNSLNQLNK